MIDDATLTLVLAALLPLLRALALVLPTASIVPALSVRGAPGPMRAAIALALAAPLVATMQTAPAEGATVWLLLGDVLRGVPLAIVIATPLWMATHVGAIADLMRGAPDANTAPPPAADGARGPLATLTALLAASVWLSSGGVVRALTLLARKGTHPTSVATWALAARTLADGIRLGFAASTGVLLASPVFSTHDRPRMRASRAVNSPT